MQSQVKMPRRGEIRYLEADKTTKKVTPNILGGFEVEKRVQLMF